jgi:putative ATP-binding cassette transporter
MNLLRYLFRESKTLLLIAIIAAVISGAAGASMAKIISDGVVEGGRHSGAAVLFFGLCLIYFSAKSCSEISLMHLVQTSILRMRVDLSRKILALPLKRLQAIGKAELFAVLTNDISTFVQAFQTLPLVFGNGLIIASCFVYMAWLSWKLFAVLATFVLASLVAYALLERIPLRRLTVLRERLDMLYEHFRNLIEGSKELQLNAQRGAHFVDGVVAPDAITFKHIFLGAMSRYTWLTNVGLILFYVMIGALLFAVPAWLLQPAGVIATYVLLLMFLIRPISDMMLSLPVLRQAGVSLAKLEQLEQAQEATGPAPLTSDPFSSDGTLHLELRGVCHHYPGPIEDNTFMLGPLDLSVGGGEVVFIVGGNGSGKTTLALLLLGFYEPERGIIVLNGVPLTTANIGNYRRYFSAVFSDFHLFEPLLTADSPELSERAQRYIERLQMGHKVKVDGGRFSTTRLSAGQRKRLALVSAYLDDRPVCVFDEWAADQDPAFKKVFYTELLPELKSRGKTVIVITHDDSYFRCADRTIKLEDGKLCRIDRGEPVTSPVAVIA